MDKSLREYAQEKTDWKKIAISTGVTFVSSFIMALAAMMPLDPEALTTATIVSFLFTAARA